MTWPASQGGDTTTTTTATPGVPPEPLNGEAIAAQMNMDFNGYKKGDATSSIGVWIHAGHDTQIHCGGDCWQGQSDCRVSGSVLNSQQMIDRDTGKPGGFFANIQTGWYVNSSKVTSKLAKCMYAWDGASNGKVNFGCGGPQGKTGETVCGNPEDLKESAFNNKVPPEYTKTSGADSPNVKPFVCNGDAFVGVMPDNGVGDACFWKGVAFDTAIGESADEIHEAIDYRIDHSKDDKSAYNDCGQSSTLCWNELILDGQLMQKEMQTDPAGTMSAILYWANPDNQPQTLQEALAEAQKLAKEMQATYKMAKPVPIIQLNRDLDVRGGDAKPFVFSPADNTLDLVA